MALSVIVTDMLTGEMFDVEEVAITDSQAQILTAYQAWQKAEVLATMHGLHAVVTQAKRQQEYCRRDFLWQGVKQKRLLLIHT